MTTVVIAVPVRNEAERLPILLTALARQRACPPFLVCCHFDGCTDESPAVAEAVAKTLHLPFVAERAPRSGPPNAGLARRRA